MRNLIFICVLLCFGYFCNAQQVGLLTGVSLSNKEVKDELIPGINIGLVIDSKQNKRVGFSGGLHFTQFSSGSYEKIIYNGTSTITVQSKRRTNALYVPLLFKFNIYDPEYRTNNDFWLVAGFLGGSNITRTSISKSMSTGKRTKSSLDIENRFLLGARTGFEISTFKNKKAAYTIGAHYDYYYNEFFDEDNFYAIGFLFKISLLFNSDD